MSIRNKCRSAARLAATFRIAALLFALAAPLPTAADADAQPSRFGGATGGIVRFPNDLQNHNDGNLFAEAWGKLSFRLRSAAGATTSIFVLGNLVGDSAGFSYNNTSKIGIGLSRAVRVNDALEVTLSARYDWFGERHTPIRRSGIRLAADFYHYRYWPEGEGRRIFGLPRRATIFKSYGTLAYPGSLVDGDRNIVLTLGGELSQDLDLPVGGLLLSPFGDFDFAWDLDQNDYNNKLVPGLGLKLRRPFEGGEVFVGIRLSADIRTVGSRIDIGPGAFMGWYKGF